MAKLLALTLLSISIPTQLFANDLNGVRGSNGISIQSTTSAALEVTPPPDIQLEPVTYIGENYEVIFDVQNSQLGAFNGSFIVENTGNDPIENWSRARI